MNDVDMNAQEKKVNKPGGFWLATEFARAAFELSSFYTYRFLSGNETKGDGHPVLVLPGFMSTDRSTKHLRKLLKKLNYEVYGWGLGRNFGNETDINRLLELVDQIYHDHRKSISIIGWSLGGIFARQLAKARPHLVRQVITMGSPFTGITDNNHVTWIHKFITNGKGDKIIDPELLADIPKPAPVPTTAIYSKQDGIVPWQHCIEEEESEIHQNIQVYSSHIGLSLIHI